MTEILTMTDVTSGYGRVQILFAVSLAARSGEVSTVIGPNGSGKSTSMRCVAGALPVTGGTICLEGRDITSLSMADRVRAGVSFVPQERTLFPTMTVHDNLMLGFWTRRRTRKDKEALSGVVDGFPQVSDWLNKRAGSLSGGQQRLVELARALIVEPKVLVLDEPTAGVAPQQVADMLGHLREAAISRNVAVLLVEQNVNEALTIADYVYGLVNGRNDVQGEAAEIGADLEGLVRRWLVGVHE